VKRNQEQACLAITSGCKLKRREFIMKKVSYFCFGIIFLFCYMVRPANGQVIGTYGDVHGTTTVGVPTYLCTVRVDNNGNITGSGSTFTVSHSESGTFCKKVESVSATLSGTCYGNQGCSHILTPTQRKPNLCNFRDLSFDFIFPGINIPSQHILLANAWSEECRDTGRNGAQITTKHPWFRDKLNVSLLFASSVAGLGGGYYQQNHGVPPVGLICDPCPQIHVKDSVQLQPDTMVTFSMSSVVTGGGVAPYIVSFSNIPTGLIVQGGNLTGRPAKGSYSGTVTVRDNCKSALNQVTRSFRFDVGESGAPSTPPKSNVIPMMPRVRGN
jgi:hypothetical protein